MKIIGRMHWSISFGGAFGAISGAFGDIFDDLDLHENSFYEDMEHFRPFVKTNIDSGSFWSYLEV